MKKFDITLLTEGRYENPQDPDWYVQNILKEDNLVQRALEARGLKVARVDWASSNFDWSSTKYVLFRSTWDYFHRFKEFSVWLTNTSKVTQFINSLDTIRWNMDKHYMADLDEKGVNIPPTIFIEKGESTTLMELHQQNDWNETILKPAISGGARHTYKLTPDILAKYEDIFQKLIKHETMLLQPFQHNIATLGEVSLMVMGGQYTHGVLKVAQPGDFRVQDEFGGTVHNYEPNKAEIKFAEKAVAACPTLPYYARVDIFTDNNGQIALGELELIEPELWFREKPEAAETLAEAIVRDLQF